MLQFLCANVIVFFLLLANEVAMAILRGGIARGPQVTAASVTVYVVLVVAMRALIWGRREA